MTVQILRDFLEGLDGDLPVIIPEDQGPRLTNTTGVSVGEESYYDFEYEKHIKCTAVLVF